MMPAEGLVLGFDTSTDRCALALGRLDGDAVTLEAQADFDAPRAALSRLLPTVSDLLSEQGLEPDDISVVVVGLGPGSFTGVRIGVSTAKGLACGLGVPLYGVGSLDAVAWRFAGREGTLGVLMDAMRGEVYPGIFRLAGDGVERLTEDRVVSPSDLAEEWARQHLSDSFMVTGTGLSKHRGHFEEAFGSRLEVAEEEMWVPSGAGVLAAFGHALRTGALGDGEPGAVLPIYTRLSDAEEAEKARKAGEGDGP